MNVSFSSYVCFEKNLLVVDDMIEIWLYINYQLDALIIIYS